MARLKKDDLLIVQWTDIQEDGGAPGEADLYVWHNVGFFYEIAPKVGGILSHVLRPAMGMGDDEKDSGKKTGWLCIPIANITQVRRLGKGQKVPLSALQEPLEADTH